MNETTKSLDEMGRVTLPAHLRAELDLGVGALVQISLKGDEIIIRKQHDSCTFCGREDALTKLNGKCICMRCRQKLCNLKED